MQYIVRVQGLLMSYATEDRAWSAWTRERRKNPYAKVEFYAINKHGVKGDIL